MTERSLPAPATLQGTAPSRPGIFSRANPPLRDWTGKRVWIVGASSGIGEAVASALHAAGAQVIVSARQQDALKAFAAAHPGSLALPVDVADAQAMQTASQAATAGGTLDLVVYCAGYYKAVRADAFSLAEMKRHQEVNYVGALHMLEGVLPGLLAQGRGHITLLGSVAGYRGLPKSLAYGPTKAALIHLAEALYLDLRGHGIGVSVVNCGFVRTPLTAQNDFRMPALIDPAQAAQCMLQGWADGAFEMHFPKRFTWVMKLLRLLPFPLYRVAVQRATGL